MQGHNKPTIVAIDDDSTGFDGLKELQAYPKTRDIHKA
jgi:hypothetical protein